MPKNNYRLPQNDTRNLSHVNIGSYDFLGSGKCGRVVEHTDNRIRLSRLTAIQGSTHCRSRYFG